MKKTSARAGGSKRGDRVGGDVMDDDNNDDGDAAAAARVPTVLLGF